MLPAMADIGRLEVICGPMFAGKTEELLRRVRRAVIAGRRVVVLEDTSTTGASPIAAVEAAREAGAEVMGVAVIVDRSTGAREKIEALGVPYHFLFDLADLGLA